MHIGTIPKNLTMKVYQLLLYFTLVSSSEGCTVSYVNHGPYHKTQSYYSFVSGYTREECEVTCSGDPECAGFGYNTGSNGCVKSKRSDPLPIETCSECWFHTKTCGSECAVTYLDHGYNFKPLSTFSSSPGSSTNACMEVCSSDPVCRGFGFDVKGLLCYFSESSYPQQTTCSACLFQSKQCTSVSATKPVSVTTKNPDTKKPLSSRDFPSSSASWYTRDFPEDSLSTTSRLNRKQTSLVSKTTISGETTSTTYTKQSTQGLFTEPSMESKNEELSTKFSIKQSTSRLFTETFTKNRHVETSTEFTTEESTSGLFTETFTKNKNVETGTQFTTEESTSGLFTETSTKNKNVDTSKKFTTEVSTSGLFTETSTENKNVKTSTKFTTEESTSGLLTETSTKNKNVKTSTKFTTEVTALSTLTATKATDTGVTEISSPTAPITKNETSSITMSSVTLQNREITTDLTSKKVTPTFDTAPPNYGNSTFSTHPNAMTSSKINQRETDSTITTIHSYSGTELSTQLSTNDKRRLPTTDRPTTINTVRPTYSFTSTIDNFTRSLFLNYTGSRTVSVEFRNQFSTTAVTTVGVDNSTAHSVCSCSCRNIDVNVEDIILQRKKELQVRVKMLSTTKRKWISAQDQRPASRAIGSVGVLVICAFCAIIIGTDIINFLLKNESKKRKVKKENE